MTVSKEEAAAFPFDHADILLASAMVSGASTPSALSEETGLTVPTVRERLLDPVRCAWLSREVREAVGSRIGEVYGHLLARVRRNGCPASAKLLLQQFNELLAPVEKKIIDHRHMHVDLSAYTLDELDKLARETARKLNRPDDKELDVTPGQSDTGTKSPDAAGAAAPSSGVSDSVVPATPGAVAADA